MPSIPTPPSPGNPARATADGRYLPWWYRGADGKPIVEAMTDSIDSEKLLPTGVRENEFYACPKENKRPCIIDPAPYEMGGKTVMMSSFNVPIMVGDQFRGAVGADLSLAFIQDLLKRADQQLYDGAGEMALIASNGRLVAYTRDDSKLGEPAGSVLDGNEVDNLKNLTIDQPLYDIDAEHGHIELFLPFTIADSGVRWTLMLQIPQAAVFGELQQLQGELSDQRQQDILGMSLAGLVVAALGLLVVWLVGYGIARPLRQLVGMLDDIAQGEGDLTRRLSSERADELGSIAKGFNTFLGKLQNMIGQVVQSVQKVSDSSEHTADIAIRTNQGVQQQLAEIELVATAVHEMTATAQDVARNATHAAEAANHADQAAHQGKQIVESSSAAIQALASESAARSAWCRTWPRTAKTSTRSWWRSAVSPSRPTCSPSTPPSRPPRAGEQGRVSRWWPTRYATWRRRPAGHRRNPEHDPAVAAGHPRRGEGHAGQPGAHRRQRAPCAPGGRSAGVDPGGIGDQRHEPDRQRRRGAERGGRGHQPQRRQHRPGRQPGGRRRRGLAGQRRADPPGRAAAAPGEISSGSGVRPGSGTPARRFQAC